MIDAAIVESVWSQFTDLGDYEANAVDVADVTPEAVVAELADGLAERFRLSP